MTAADAPRRDRAPAVLPDHLQAVLDRYAGRLAMATMLNDYIRRACTSRPAATSPGSPRPTSTATRLPTRPPATAPSATTAPHLQTVAKRKPSTINTALATLGDFYTRLGLGTLTAAPLDLPKRAPRALDCRDSLRWLRTVERWLSPRDRVVSLLPNYAGLRLGEVASRSTWTTCSCPPARASSSPSGRRPGPMCGLMGGRYSS